jgi:DNA-3-methyladenine glycosylase II
LGPGHDKVLALLAWPYGGSSVRTTDPPLSNFEKALTGADPNLGRVIAAVVARIGQQRINPSKSTPYEALARAVVYQSISAGAAAIIFGRLQQAVTKPFSPAKVLRMTEHSITATGLSKAKARAIVSLAEWFMANRKLAKALPDLPDADVVSALTNIAGIGTWTANVFLIFNLGRLDVTPASDVGIRRGVQLTYQLQGVATPSQVREKSQRWRPYRSIASIYLWNAVKLNLSAHDLE